jgi:hypothetical protein
MLHHRLSHRVGRSSQATPAAVEKSQPSLTHRIQDTPYLRVCILLQELSAEELLIRRNRVPIFRSSPERVICIPNALSENIYYDRAAVEQIAKVGFHRIAGSESV